MECILEGKLTSFMSKFSNRRIIGENGMYMWIFFLICWPCLWEILGAFASPECSKSQKLTQTGPATARSKN